MPGFDGTGPQGMGPMTGGARGFCAVPGVTANIGTGAVRQSFYGRGSGRGGGRGRRNWYYASGLPGWVRAAYGYPAFGGRVYPDKVESTAKEEISLLREQAQFLKSQLENIQARIATLDSVSAQEPKKED